MKDIKNLDLILSKLSKEDKEQILSLVAQKDSEIQEWKQRAMHLEELLNAKRKEKFCISSEQLSLFDDADLIENINTLEEVCEKNGELPEELKKQRAKRVTRIEDGNLPVSIIHVTSDNPEYKDIHSDHVVRTLVRVPSKMYIRETHYHKYKDQDGKIVLHGYTESPFGKAMIDSSVVADIASQRYVMSIPLYRQEQEYSRCGLYLPRQDMVRWLRQGKNMFDPVLRLIDQYILSSEILRSDETPFNVLEIKNEKPTLSKSTSYVWAISTGKGYHTAFHYMEGSRSRDTLTSFLGTNGMRRYIQSDHYSGYDNIPGVDNVFCLAHIRRYFFQCISRNTPSDSLSRFVVSTIDSMYHEERLIQEEHAGDYATIRSLRMERIKPIYDILRTKIENEGLRYSQKTRIGAAIQYFSNAHKGFENVFKDGRLELDNNFSEREAIKPFVIGRKNSLFAITRDGAEMTCGYYSIVRTAQFNGLVPYEYLIYLFDNLPYREDDKFDYTSFLPWADGIQERVKEHINNKFKN